jgi:hypothetical protein
MTDNPYAAPNSIVADVAEKWRAPDAVLKKIKGAWICGTISACLTLAVTILALSGTRLYGFTGWELVDVALIAGLTFGIYVKSRTCAVIMLVYFILAKILLIMQTGKPDGLLMGFVFIYFYFQGVLGTFEFHKLEKLHAQRFLTSE